jgi:uncharacterized protein
VSRSKEPWYHPGLCFECAQCGRCCSGPGEGYIWVTGPESERIARHLGISQQELRKRYVKRVGWRMSIVEEASTKDCIFLHVHNGVRSCAIYDVRPNQCRTWPFWRHNIDNPDAWHVASQRCPGMNRGRQYSRVEIERLVEQKKWWEDDN